MDVSTKTQTLEEAWHALFEDILDYEDDADAKARALALAVLRVTITEAELRGGWIDADADDLRRRIEELGQ